MKELWVLYERSDIDRGGEWDYQNYRTSCRVFQDFGVAKKAMKELIKSYALNENSMFDGNGCIKNYDYESYYSDDFMWPDMKEEKELFASIKELLKKLCTDELQKSELEEITDCFVTNYMYAAEITTTDEIVLLIRGDDDGPCNGINPYVHTNIFEMDNEKKDYFFYLEDMFTEDDFASHLFIDLKKVEVE